MEKHIPEGYKQTEVGVIPEDWGVERLGNAIFHIIDNRGKTPPLAKSGHPLIEVNAIYNQGKTPTLKKVTKYVDDITYSNWFRTGHPHTGDLLIVTVGSPGTPSYMKGSIGCIAQNIIGLRLKNEHNSEFVYYALCTKTFKKQVQAVLMGAVQPSLKVPHLQRLSIPLPPIEEQQAIATALSDVDNLITSLEQLIEKKKAIKQGTMQELLTGRRRLEGFGEGKGYKQTDLGMIPEDWEVKRLHELGKFQSGIGFPLYLQGKQQEVIPFYKVSDMNNNGNEVLMLNSNNYISEKDLMKLGATIIPRSSIVFAKIGAALFLERKRILLMDSLIDNNMMAIIADIDNIDVKYLYYLLMNTKLSKYANTTALPSINRNDIGEIKFKIPSLHEQEAITQVLTNMDTEIENLEAKVDKYKQIKQGMMQNLLTGRIRLK